MRAPGPEHLITARLLRSGRPTPDGESVFTDGEQQVKFDQNGQFKEAVDQKTGDIVRPLFDVANEILSTSSRSRCVGDGVCFTN